MIFERPFTVLDGGLSTALESLGHPPQGHLWTAALLIEEPSAIVAAHRQALAAGAEVVITSSYQASAQGFVDAGASPVEATALLASTTDLARAAGAPTVAGSIGPYGAVLHDRSEYHGRYSASWHEVRAFHRARLEVLAATRPDVFAVETMPSAREAAIVVEELAAVTSIPAWVTFTCPDAEHTGYGDAFADAVAAVDHPQVIAVGVNCTAPEHVSGLLAAAGSDRPLVAYPNVGPVTPHAREWATLGARLIGGCCGVGSAEIAALRRLRDGE